MRRREFITFLSGAAATWPIAARAQQPERMRCIVVMMGLGETNREGRQEAAALRQGLQDLGWTDGRNIRIDFHWDVGEPGRAQIIAKDVVAVRPDLIVTHASPATGAVFQLTKSIPLVFVSVVDPIGLSLLSSFARPGGNVTGFTNFEASVGGKWLELLKEAAPRVTHITLLFNRQTVPFAENYLHAAQAAAQILGVTVTPAPSTSTAELETAIAAAAATPGGGIIAMFDTFLAEHRDFLVALAIRYRLPAIYGSQFFAPSGGLMAYAADYPDIF